MKTICISAALSAAFLSAGCATAAGGSSTTLGGIFAILGLLAWFEALVVDLIWDA